MKSQKQMFYSAQNKFAEKIEFFNWLSKQENRPTKEELKILKKKNPSWNSYPESFCL